MLHVEGLSVLLCPLQLELHKDDKKRRDGVCISVCVRKRSSYFVSFVELSQIIFITFCKFLLIFIEQSFCLLKGSFSFMNSYFKDVH